MNWVKVAGSDVRLEYPQKQVIHPADCQCNKFQPHWHYEDDLTAEPRKVKLTPTLLEDNGDGTYTGWSYSLFGSIGQSGKLTEGVEVVPLKTKADFAEAQRLEAMIQRGIERSQSWFNVYRAHEQLTAVEV